MNTEKREGKPPTSARETCHVCRVGDLELCPAYRRLLRVTSDCKPWPKGGALGVCKVCGCVQKRVDAQWRREIEEIYSGYSVYSQSDGVEQAVFDSSTGVSAARSERLVDRLEQALDLSSTGHLLDVGCGNGALLRVFSDKFPSWTLAGNELTANTRAEVEAIRGVEALHVGPSLEVPGRFDLITLLHVLEHIENPVEFLEGLKGRFLPGGKLFIEVPGYQQNAFDLLIADHCTHFTAESLAAILTRAGYMVLHLSQEWVRKEISVIATPVEGGSPKELETPPDVFPWIEEIESRVNWLQSVADSARSVSKQAPLGILGTSIAGTWLVETLGEQVHFFVEEDPARIGKRHLHRPILPVGDVQPGSAVFIALPPNIAKRIKTRLEKKRPEVEWIIPPPLP